MTEIETQPEYDDIILVAVSPSHEVNTLPTCRYCLDHEPVNQLFSPCRCTGTTKWIHRSCLSRWLLESQQTDTPQSCEICKSLYVIDRPEEDNYTQCMGTHCHKRICHICARFVAVAVCNLMCASTTLCLLMVLINDNHRRKQLQELVVTLTIPSSTPISAAGELVTIAGYILVIGSGILSPLISTYVNAININTSQDRLRSNICTGLVAIQQTLRSPVIVPMIVIDVVGIMFVYTRMYGFVLFATILASWMAFSSPQYILSTSDPSYDVNNYATIQGTQYNDTP